MSGYSYITAGISIVNDIRFADGSEARGVLGGCCIYAYSGIACDTGAVLPVTAGGPDFRALYGDYFARNAVPYDGVYETMPATHHTLLAYEPDGRWSERPIFGNDYFAVQKQNCMTKAAELLPFLGADTKGIYLDALADDGIFSQLPQLRAAAPNARILWEPPTVSSKDPALRGAVRAHILAFDAYSMNLDEAAAFFGVQTRSDILAAVAALGKPCFLREGTEGASWCEAGAASHLPAWRPDDSADPTGCGNCSTAASLYGWCEGYDGRGITAYANAAAALCARQRGPADVLRARQSGEARAIAKQLLTEA